LSERQRTAIASTGNAASAAIASMASGQLGITNVIARRLAHQPNTSTTSLNVPLFSVSSRR
jgi:hypothetical protein